MIDRLDPNYEELAFLLLVALAAVLYVEGGWWLRRVGHVIEFWEQIGPVILGEVLGATAPLQDVLRLGLG